MHTHTHSIFTSFCKNPNLCSSPHSLSIKKKKTSLIKIKMFHSANHEILEAYTLFLNFLN